MSENDIKFKPPKPPLGVTPRSIHDLLRAKAIIEAMARYIEVDYFPRPEWVDELKEITNRYEVKT